MACSVTGTMTTDCAARSVATCESADNCCTWLTSHPPAKCVKKACSALSNPDVCAGCFTCSNLWTISNARGNTPWNIIANGGIEVNAGGSIRVSPGRLLDAGSYGCKTSETNSIRVGLGATLKC